MNKNKIIETIEYVSDPKIVFIIMVLTFWGLKIVRKCFPILHFSLQILIYYLLFLVLGFYYDTDQSEFYQYQGIIGGLCIFMALFSFIITSKKDPGYIKINKKIVKEDKNDNYQSNLNNNLNEYSSFCIKCNIDKPERTHHCSKCGRCVMNMDHHCKWTRNCIGFYNRKSFILVLFWGSLSMLAAVVFSINKIVFIPQQLIDEKNKQIFSVFTIIRLLFTMVLYLSSFFFFLCLFIFFLFHLQLLLRNKVTLVLQKDPKKAKDKKYQENYIKESTIYNIGCINNFLFYFGNNPFLWLLPVGSPQGNGIQYPIKNDKFAVNYKLKQILQNKQIQDEEIQKLKE